MTNKKLTDNEIIKALECCDNNKQCTECPMNDSYPFCDDVIGGIALDLINRQKAEIERLRAVVEKTDAAFYRKVDEVNRARVEAIKEFVDRLKKELSLFKRECRKHLDNDGAFVIDKARKIIDNLLNELAGDNNDL